jgi:hypothetical protein
MAPQTKKRSSRPQTSERAKEAPPKAEKKVLHMEHEGVREAMRVAEDVNHATTQCMEACSENLAACVESGTVATRILKDMSTEMIRDINHVYTDYMQFSKDILACRTLKDVVEIQNKLTQERTAQFLERSEKWFNLMFDGCKEAIEPLETQSSVASDQLRKAMAA